MNAFNRRSFLKKTSIGLLPAVVPFGSIMANEFEKDEAVASATKTITFSGDGVMFDPGTYLDVLQKAHTANPIIKDRYGAGGVVELLSKKFEGITGKEKAIFMPSGTMANQLALSVLSGENSKIIVQDTSHVYRDEADAAQSIFHKRLIPLAPNETFFTAKQLIETITHLKDNEAFRTGIGAVSIENPVRRTSGKTVPLEEIKLISEYCRANKIKLHLDGARIYMASGWTGISIKEYASYFDTVYISLYKYLGASGGAMLCGPEEVIEKMHHLIKVHGGSMYGNWTNAAMALHRIAGFENRLKEAINASKYIFSELNKLPSFNVKPLSGGTNIYTMQLANGINGEKMREKLIKDFNISIPFPNQQNVVSIMVNETLIYQSTDEIINAFKKSVV